MKLWKKSYDLNKEVEKYTVGKDPSLDLALVKYDCLASIAHAKMLCKIGVLSDEEKGDLISGLNEIIKLSDNCEFKIEVSDEDCHTAIEKYLVEKLGDTGKKIHTARSRNDQVLTALRLYEKKELSSIIELMNELSETLNEKVKNFGDVKIPGYTHMQKAMPTTIGTWLENFVFAIEDDLKLLDSISDIIDQSPLGSAAGFGVPVFDIDCEMTAKGMGFKKVMENPIYAQLSRGKFESNILNGVSQVMLVLNKMANDLILYNMKEFGFVSLPVELCTGSSIMPQKKNPDVLELVRASYHIVLGDEMKVKGIIGNLISGYNRDLQLTKEPLMNSIEILKSSLKMMILVIDGLEINESNCDAAMSEELYATEEAYKLVRDGVPFREAYRQVGEKFLAK